MRKSTNKSQYVQPSCIHNKSNNVQMPWIPEKCPKNRIFKSFSIKLMKNKHEERPIVFICNLLESLQLKLMSP